MIAMEDADDDHASTATKICTVCTDYSHMQRATAHVYLHLHLHLLGLLKGVLWEDLGSDVCISSC